MASTASLQLDFVTLDVFTDTRFSGNPLAVVFVPAKLRPRISQETKQRIAREFNLSETVFLHTLESEPDAEVTSREIDIFTIEEELPFAGHPTIGAAYTVLRHLGWTQVDTLLTKAGPIRIASQGAGTGSVKAAIPHAVHIHQQTLGRILQSESAPSDACAAIENALSDDPEIRAAELAAPPVSIVRGMTFLLVRLPSLEHLARVSTAKRLDLGKVPGLLDVGDWQKSFVARYYYVPTNEPDTQVGRESQEWAIRTRMVELGFEDPATGSAACTLASYLTISLKAVHGVRLAIVQGVEMGRRSEIRVDATAETDNGGVRIKELFLGGETVMLMGGRITVQLRRALTDLPKSILELKRHDAPPGRTTNRTSSPPKTLIMLCALSGEVPEEPVVSKKTGTVFEKRLILKYIEENGKEPGTDEELDPEDLLPVKTARVVRPRPPNLTSLPSLLKAFQDEWDALVLESYNTKEQLARTREELATALYQHDAAVRVIARLTKERDEARDALSKVTVTAGDASNGDAMMIDSEGLPEKLAEHVDEVHQRLTKGRKKRPIPQSWASPDNVAALERTVYTDLSISQASSLDLESDYAAVGGLDGKVDIYSTQTNNLERSLDIGEPVTSTVWQDTKVMIATSKGSVKVYESGSEVASFKEHAGAVTGLCLHSGGELLASVGADKSFVFYHLPTLKRVMRVYTDAALTTCAFHPDGHLFAAGTQSGDIKVFDTKTGQQAAVFTLGAPVQALVFSENGFWFAASGKGQSSVTVFDLRKDGEAAKVKELQTGDAQSLAWDYTGQYLATAGSNGVTVQQYLKSSKAWSEPLRSSLPAVGVRWGSEARSLVIVSRDGVVSVLGPKE
ncbi:WD40-repeat-containing domain protein [Diplogelasinospora grovesii]|uniref:Pre-mRNA-processing factor 19 n=1 Tax=Diplogelasinospora grovesii TaxID=303347 RepID=A0AAN6NEL6_9PEZI|nr:WD40-repeat-containing domain protein [Diplogelasinospora grovesii]